MSSLKLLCATFALWSASCSELPADELWHEEMVDDIEFNQIDFRSNFLNFKQHYDKNYETDQEEVHRFHLFIENWRMIYSHNSKEDSTYRMRLNRFGDWTQEEVRKTMFGGEEGCIHSRDDQHYKLSDYYVKSKSGENINVESLPSSIDWTDYNGKSYVTPVKDQGDCGSCWAFSTTGSLESFYAIATETTGDDITELSEQQLVDCTYAIPDGCQGGLQEDAFTYIAKNGGLCTEKEYPYTGRDGSCEEDSCGTFYNNITGYVPVTKKNETDLAVAIAIGPVAVSIDAAGPGWTYYSSGIYSKECGIDLDHGVLGVGYGADDKGNEYWKIKNSWGTDWGLDGYILICKDCDKDGDHGECGILDDNTYPVLPSDV